MSIRPAKIMAVALITAAVIFVANLLVDNPYSHQMVRSAINEKLGSLTKISLEFQALEVRAFPPAVVLYGVKVTPRDAPQAPLLEAAHVTARVSIASLLLGKPALGLVEANELKVAFPFPPEFTGFLLEPPPEEPNVTWPPDIDLPIERLVLINSKLEWHLPDDDPKKPDVLHAALDGVNLDFRFDSWTSMDAELEVRSTNFWVWGRHLAQDALFATDLELKDNEIRADHLEVTSKDLNFTGDVAAKLGVEKERDRSIRAKKLLISTMTNVDLSVIANVKNTDLAVLGRFLDVDDTSGQVSGSANVNVAIPMNGPVTWGVAAAAQVKDGYLDGFRLFDSKTNLAIDAEKIHFSDIEIRKGEETYGAASGTINFDTAISFSFVGRPNAMPLATLLDAVHVKDFKVLDGQLFSDGVTVAGTGAPFHLDVHGLGDLKNVRVPLISFDQSRFPDAPHCQLAIKLAADKTRLTFGGSQAACRPSQAPEPPPLNEPLTPPSGGSLLSFAGFTTFDQKDGMDLTITAPTFEAKIAEHFAQIPLAGSVNLKTRIHGPYPDLKVVTDFKADTLDAAGVMFGKTGGTITAAVAKESVSFDAVRVKFKETGYFQIDRGTLKTTAGFPLDLTISAKNLPPGVIGTLARQVDPQIAFGLGITSLKGKIQGPLFHPLAWNTDLEFDLSDMSMDGETFFHQLSGHLTGTKDGFKLDETLYGLGELKAQVSATHRRKRPFALKEAESATDLLEKLGMRHDDAVTLHVATVKKANKRIRSPDGRDGADHLELLPYAGAHLKKIGIAGQIVLDATLEGTFRKLTGRFQGVLDNPVFFGSPLAPVYVTGFVDGSKIDIPEITHSGNALVGRLNFDFLAEGVPFQWYLNFNGFDLRAVLPALFYEDPRNFAYATGSWQLAGKFLDFWHAKGQLDLQGIEMNFVPMTIGLHEKVEVRHEFPITILMNEKGWNIADGRELYLRSNYGAFLVSTKNNRPPQQLGVQFKGNVDVGVLRHFSQIVETARGKVLFDGALTGSVAEPKFGFSLEDKKADPFNAAGWEPITIGLIDVPPAFTNIRLKATFKNNRLEIKQLTAEKGKAGRLSITGVFAPFSNDEEASNILISAEQLETNRLPVPVFKSADLIASGDLVLSGNHFPLRLSGNIVIDKAQSLTNFDVRNQIIEAMRINRISSPGTAPEDPYLKFDLHIAADNSILIKNRNLVARLSTDIKLLGTEEAPVLLGQIQIPKGKFNYKRDFDIQRGVIQFDEPVSPPDPRLDIIGESQISRYRVQVMINGYASDPKVSLATDPPTRPDGTAITKLDTLVLLTSGQLPDSDRSIGASGNVARSEALNLVIGQFEEPIERLFDLSGQTVVRQIYLDTYTSEDDGDPVARLNLPISISDEVNVIFQVDNDANMKISSEYSLHESISVSGSLDRKKEDEGQKNKNLPQDTDTGVDLKFRFSFP